MSYAFDGAGSRPAPVPGSATGPLPHLAQWIMLTSGWRRLLVSIAAGAVGALAMPPFGALPALVVSLSIAVWLIDGAATGRRGNRGAVLACAVIGWAWGFGYLTAGLWWLGSAFLVEADEFLWALPLGVIGLPAVLALFYAAGFALARVLWSQGPARIAALAVGISASEWLRGHLFTGFPWNTLGMALGQNLWLMQSASVIGLYGLTLLAVPDRGSARHPRHRHNGTRALRTGPGGLRRTRRDGAVRDRSSAADSHGDSGRGTSAAGPAEPQPGREVPPGKSGRHHRLVHRSQ